MRQTRPPAEGRQRIRAASRRERKRKEEDPGSILTVFCSSSFVFPRYVLAAVILLRSGGTRSQSPTRSIEFGVGVGGESAQRQISRLHPGRQWRSPFCADWVSDLSTGSPVAHTRPGLCLPGRSDRRCTWGSPSFSSYSIKVRQTSQAITSDVLRLLRHSAGRPIPSTTTTSRPTWPREFLSGNPHPTGALLGALSVETSSSPIRVGRLPCITPRSFSAAP